MYLSRRFYLFILVIILLLCGGYMLGTLFLLGQIALAVLIFAVAMDFFLLYRTKGIRSFRQCSSRFSNGDDNISITYH